eukprot:PhM_4_TR15493/c0_g1_i1/m.32613
MLLELLAVNGIALGIIYYFREDVGKSCLIRGQTTSGDAARGIDTMAYNQCPERDSEKRRDSEPMAYAFDWAADGSASNQSASSSSLLSHDKSRQVHSRLDEPHNQQIKSRWL